jgi:hypothetical protein
MGVPVTSYSLGQEHVGYKIFACCCLLSFFAGYLMGVPVTSYSLAIGEQHVELIDMTCCCIVMLLMTCAGSGYLQVT